MQIKDTTLLLCSIYLLHTSAHAGIDPKSLTKVTKKNNPQCVEFYHYQGELYCNASAVASNVVDPHIKDYETQNIIFDERPWQAVWGKRNKEITTVEYVPAGNKINDWQELVTSQFVPGIQNKVTPKQYFEAVVQQLRNSGFNPIVEIKKESHEQILFEFRIAAPENLKQDELQIVNKGPDGFYITHYVIKQADMGKQKREKWQKILGKVSIKQKGK